MELRLSETAFFEIDNPKPLDIYTTCCKCQTRVEQVDTIARM